MTTQMITVKMDDSFLREIDTIVEKQGYQNRTEFIRKALREKIEDARIRDAIANLAKLKGASKKQTSDAELEAIREKVFQEFKGRSPRA